MKIRVTFEITEREKIRLQEILGKKKGINFDDYRSVIKKILKNSLIMKSEDY